MKVIFIKQKQTLVISAILIIVSLLSFFVLSKTFSKPELFSNTINSIEQKQETVSMLLASTTGTAVAIASIPGDATTPLSNQIIEINKFLVTVVIALTLEKLLLPTIGLFTFKYLLPFSCILALFALFAKKQKMLALSCKIAIFGIILFISIPISYNISDVIYETNAKYKIEESIETFDTTKDSEKVVESEKDTASGIVGKLKNIANSITDSSKKIVNTTINKFKELLKNLIDTVSILIVTTCLIPIASVLLIFWAVKILFGLDIAISKKIFMPFTNSNEKHIENE